MRWTRKNKGAHCRVAVGLELEIIYDMYTSQWVAYVFSRRVSQHSTLDDAISAAERVAKVRLKQAIERLGD